MNADNPKQTETFDRYLEGQMNRRERFEFEARLRIDPDFADAFELHKEIDFILFQDELNFFRQELDKLIQQNDGKPKNAPMMLSRNDNDDLEEAILDQDVIDLRSKLTDIFSEAEDEIASEDIPHYAPIEKAVADQDAVALHDELEKFSIDPDFDLAAELSEEEILDHEVDEAIKETDVIEFRSTLNKVTEELMSEKTKKTIPLHSSVVRIIAAAAMIVVLVGSGLFINRQNNSSYFVDNRLDKLVGDDFGPGPARGGSTELTDYNRPWVDFAYSEYMDKEYEDAAKAYKIIDETDLGGANTWIYQAKSLYELKDYTEALRYFEKINDNNDNIFLEESQWYIIKCLVHLNKIDDALANLEVIINSDKKHDFKVEAKKLYRKIK